MEMDSSEPKPRVQDDDGIDVSLIRWMLSLSPAERLQVLQQQVRNILKIRADNTAQ